MVDRLNMIIGELFTRMRREEGQGMAEYALVLGLVIAIGAAVTASGVAGSIGTTFKNLAGQL